MIVSFDIPDALATELNQIAQDNGFTNAKQMVIFYLRATIKGNRVKAANLDAIREAAEAQADQDTGVIS